MLEKCDCLNFCGDDNAVYKGKAQPCQSFLDHARAAERARDLAHVIALLEQHARLLPANEHVSFELTYTRNTRWMAVMAAAPSGAVIAQGDTPGQACAIALQKLKAAA